MHNEEEKEVALGEVILDDEAILEDVLLEDDDVDELLGEEEVIDEDGEEDLVDEDEIDLDIAWKDDY